MAPEPVKFRRFTDAPILNPYIARAEATLVALKKGLGDKNASRITAKYLDGLGGAEMPGAGELKQGYKLRADDVKDYQDQWNSLDDQIAELAAVSADVANDVTTQVDILEGAVKDILADVVDDPPDRPTAVEQVGAVEAIDKVIGKAVDAVWAAFNELDRQAWNSPPGGGNTNGGGAPSGGAPPWTPSFGSNLPADTYTGGDPATDATAAPLEGGERASAENIYRRLIDKYGLTPAQAAGIIGNMQVEAPGLNTGAYNPKEGAYGLCQWLGGRRENLNAFAAAQGKPVSDWETQVDFMMHELGGKESAAFNRLKATDTPGAAAAVFDYYYERSSGEMRDQRIANANNVATAMTNVAA
ncbi:phage tail tip lysozyme [Nocardia sp. NPDC059180]|uniref:phage tail tip lysozyme n=1 Tax=Nocardia sp. NPDC059180 TaxID=3346761 RepID=UPI0036C03BB5